MAKLKNSFATKKNAKLPDLGIGSQSSGNASRVAIPKNVSGQSVNQSKAGSLVQAVGFGALHTKAKGSASGSQWGGLLSSATSGGASGAIGGGILSAGTLGFIGKLLSLFGESKSTPAAPTPFVMPASQVTSLTIGSPNATSSVALGVQSSVNAGGQGGPIYQQNATGTDHAAQTAHVVQIVKQALLTSSSLNDVISEI